MHIQIQIQMSIGITHAVSPLCRGSSILRCESQVGLGGPWSCHHLDSWSIWRFWIWWWYHSSDLFRSFTDWLACPFIKRQKYFFASLRSQDSHLKKRPCVNSLGSFLRRDSLPVFASPCFRIYDWDFVCGGSFQTRCGKVCASLCRCICFLNILKTSYVWGSRHEFINQLGHGVCTNPKASASLISYQTGWSLDIGTFVSIISVCVTMLTQCITLFPKLGLSRSHSTY